MLPAFQNLTNALWVETDGQFSPETSWNPAQPSVLVPGAFNPLHDGHLALVGLAQRLTGKAGRLRIERNQRGQAGIGCRGNSSPSGSICRPSAGLADACPAFHGQGQALPESDLRHRRGYGGAPGGAALLPGRRTTPPPSIGTFSRPELPVFGRGTARCRRSVSGPGGHRHSRSLSRSVPGDSRT